MKRFYLYVERMLVSMVPTIQPFLSGNIVAVIIVGLAVVVYEINFNVSMLCHGNTRTLHENIPVSHDYGTWVYRGRQYFVTIKQLSKIKIKEKKFLVWLKARRIVYIFRKIDFF